LKCIKVQVSPLDKVLHKIGDKTIIKSKDDILIYEIDVEESYNLIKELSKYYESITWSFNDILNRLTIKKLTL